MALPRRVEVLFDEGEHEALRREAIRRIPAPGSYAQSGPHPYRERGGNHAAVVHTYGLEGIVSTDRALDRVPGLVRFDPATLAREGG